MKSIVVTLVHRMDTPAPTTPCLSCGYNLAGLIGSDGLATCPECGKHQDPLVQEPVTRPAWVKPLVIMSLLPSIASIPPWVAMHVFGSRDLGENLWVLVPATWLGVPAAYAGLALTGRRPFVPTVPVAIAAVPIALVATLVTVAFLKWLTFLGELL